MKGYATIEFLISGAFFLAFVVFIIVQTGRYVVHNYIYSDSIMSISRSQRLFYMLFFLPGVPPDWSDASSATAIGFSDGYYRINRTKLGNFMSYCSSNYQSLVEKIGRPFYVSVQSGGNVWKCPSVRKYQTIKRTMVMDGDYAYVEVGTV